MKKMYVFIGRNEGKPITISFNRNKTLTLKFGDIVKLEDSEYTAYSQFFAPKIKEKVEEVDINVVLDDSLNDISISQVIKVDEEVEEEKEIEVEFYDTIQVVEADGTISEEIEIEPIIPVENATEDNKYKEADLYELKNKELKKICKTLKVDDKGNKKQLVERILENI